MPTTWSFPGICRLALALFACGAYGCAEGAGDSPRRGGDGEGGGATSTSGSGGVLVPADAGADSATAPIASWDVDSNIIVNDHPIADDIQSAVALHDVFNGKDHLSVKLTDVPSFCEALASESCGEEPHFSFALDLQGITPGTYDIEEGEASAWFGDVTSSCLSGGLGSSAGTVTFSKIDLGAVGVIEVTFDLEFLFGQAKGTVVAPLCAYDPTP